MMTMLPPGTYKVLEDALLLIWPKEYGERYAAAYRVGKVCEDLPAGFRVKTGQEIVLEHGSYDPLITEIGELKSTINAVNVTVRVGSKVFTGVTLTYDRNLPSIVESRTALRQVKKRNK